MLYYFCRDKGSALTVQTSFPKEIRKLISVIFAECSISFFPYSTTIYTKYFPQICAKQKIPEIAR